MTAAPPHAASIIDNLDVDGPGSIVSLNPTSGEPLGQVAALDEAGASAAVEAASRAFARWSATPVRERQRLLARWLDVIVDGEDELARLVSLEGGKPVAESRLVDIFPACEALSFMARKAHRLLAFEPEPPEQLLFAHWRAGYRHDPLGVIAAITPWNYPVGIPVIQLASVLAAGNTVVFKPASATVLTGLWLADAARRAGFPPGVVNAVALPGRATDSLVDHPAVAKVLFTGSVEVGRRVAERCAARLAPCQLELGGKDAAVVAADACLERTAMGLVWGAFMNTGQTCASVERVYVERALYEPLVERVVALTRQLRVGDPFAPETDIGPMTTAGQRETVAAQVGEALAAGAKALTGGALPEGPGFFYPPTVLVDVRDEMAVMTEETFGPVLPIVPVESLDEAIVKANGSRFGLTASGWTRSRTTAERLQRELAAGVVSINDHVVAFGEASGSWGGLRESGIGRSHGRSGLMEVCNRKYVTVDPGRRPAEAWQYPYDADFALAMRAILPAFFSRGRQRLRALLRLVGTRRFLQRVRKGSLISNIALVFR